MIEEYVPMNRRHDDFYERFMEQRIHKINNSDQPGMDDWLTFPIQPLRSAPSTLPRKRVSKTSKDSGVDYPLVLSPAMPVTPENSRHLQPNLKPSTSRMSPLSGLLTPIQQFIINSRNSKNKGPEYNRSQPNHPDPQSVPRNRTCHDYKAYIFGIDLNQFIYA